MGGLVGKRIHYTVMKTCMVAATVYVFMTVYCIQYTEYMMKERIGIGAFIAFMVVVSFSWFYLC